MSLPQKVLYCFTSIGCLLSSFVSAGATTASAPSGLVFKSMSYLESNIDVPLDWNDPTGPQITVVARVHNPQAHDKPFMFFVGGGPTMESINGYSAIAQGYGQDRDLSELGKNYRIVTFDQRGFGRSTPLDRYSTEMDPAMIHRLFSAPAIAKDLARLIERIAGRATPFYLAGHSFGGEPIAHYLVQAEGPRPRGVLFLSAAPALMDSTTFFHERMRAQIAMNQRIQSEYPELFEKIMKARIFIAEQLGNLDDSRVLLSGLDANFAYLGNRHQLRNELDRVLVLKPGEIEKLKGVLHTSMPFSDLMTYVLDWSFQRRVSQKDLVANLPAEISEKIEPWMLLEHRALMSAERQRLTSNEAQEFMSLADEKLRDAIVPLDLARLKEALRHVPTIMVLGISDSFVPFEQMRDSFSKVSSSPIHHFEPIEGPNSDHFSSYRPEVMEWAMEKMKELEAMAPCEAVLELAAK